MEDWDSRAETWAEVKTPPEINLGGILTVSLLEAKSHWLSSHFLKVYAYLIMLSIKLSAHTHGLKRKYKQ